MDIYILNSNLKKIKRINRYTYAEYTPLTRGIGTFRIDMILDSDNNFLLDKKQNYYVLFDYKEFGKIYNVSKTKSEESEYQEIISISGELSNTIFSKRVIANTITHSGYSYELIVKIINECLAKPSDGKRKIDIKTINFDKQILDKKCSKVNKQVTGKYAWDEIKSLLEQDMLSIQLVPNVVSTIVKNGVETNIDSWIVELFLGDDRTKGNKDGNSVVLFSQGLSNIQRTEYYIDNKEYCTSAYIAGEGEKDKRKWFEVNNKQDKDVTDLSGWNRTELWIDARDIQSEQPDGSTLTQQQYEELINQRAGEKFSKHRKNEIFNATLITTDERYVLNKDFYVGDFVTVKDQNLNQLINAQIVGYTKSSIGDREIIDIIISYGQENENFNVINSQQKMSELIESAMNNIKFLDDEINPLKMSITSKDDILKLKLENGLMLIVQNIVPNMVLTTAWKELYYGTVDLGKWQEPFKQIPWVLNVFAYSTAEVNYLNTKVKATNTDIGQYDFCSHTQMDNKPINVYVVALGFWK